MAYRKMTCPECSKVLRPAKPVPAGKKVRCPECEHVFYPEDSINPVEVAEEEAAPRARRSEPAKKGGKQEAAPPKEGEETYGYIKEEEPDPEAEDQKPKIDYSLNTKVKDLRGPAQAIIMSPSNKLTLAGFVGVGGWLVLLVFLLIPAMFPLKPDERKKLPVQRLKPGLSHVSPTGPSALGGGGGGGFGGFMPGPSADKQKKVATPEEQKPGFYEIGGYDIAVICDLAWYLFLVSLIPILFCTCWSAMVAFGAIQMQNMESRAWGIIGSVMAMLPINVGGLQIMTALVIQIVLIQVIDDTAFIGYVVVVVTSIEYLLSLAAGVWALLTLMNQEVIDGFEYVAE